MAAPISNRRLNPSGDYETDVDDLSGTLNAHMSDVQNALSQGLTRVSNLGCLTWTFKVNVPSNYFPPSFVNSWVNLGGSFGNVAFFKDAFGIVRLTGVMKSGTVPGNAFILPVGFRPASSLVFGVSSNGGTGRVDVDSSGQVIVQSPSSNVYVGLDGIAFQCADISPYVPSCFPVLKTCTLPAGQASWVELDAVVDVTNGLTAPSAPISVATSLAWSNRGGNISIDNITGLIPGRTYLIQATAWQKG